MKRWTPRNVIVVMAVGSLCVALPASIAFRGAQVREAQASGDRLRLCEIERDAAQADVDSMEVVWPGLLDRCKDTRKDEQADHQKQVDTLMERINHCWPGECVDKLVSCENNHKSETWWYKKRLQECGCKGY